jgi:hypothetical protein
MIHLFIMRLISVMIGPETESYNVYHSTHYEYYSRLVSPQLQYVGVPFTSDLLDQTFTCPEI